MDIHGLEGKLQLLVEASTTLLGSVHLEDPCPSILATVGRVTEASACAVWRADGEKGIWHISAHLGLSDSFAAIQVSVPEGPAQSEERRKQQEVEGIRSLLAMPVELPEGPGLVALYYHAPREFSDGEIRIASGMANATAAALRSWELLREREQSRIRMEFTVRALREQDERLSLALEAGNFGFWEWDPSTGHVFCSDRMKAILGFGAGKFDGCLNTFLSRIHPQDRGRFEEAMAQAQSRAARFEEEFRVADPGRPERWVVGRGKAILDDHGDLMRVVGVGVDITERHLLEARLREAQKRESVGLLAAGVAHDFNNLLTGIMGNASLASEMMSRSDVTRSMLDNVIDASRRAAELTNQLLAYSGQGKYVVTPVSLASIVRNIRDMLEANVNRRVKLSLDIQDDIPLVEADAAQVQQMILNLVINASEAIGEEPGNIEIRIGEVSDSLGDTGEHPCVYLEVSDTGCGMDSATQERIFDPFFTTKFTGRGLGLPAVSGIVRGHRGTIQVTSAPGKGSTFRVVLPAGRYRQAAGSVAGNSAA